MELKNANTINYTTPANEQIDNAELQEKATASSGLDDNENDKVSKIDNETNAETTEAANVSPVAVNMNNGSITDES